MRSSKGLALGIGLLVSAGLVALYRLGWLTPVELWLKGGLGALVPPPTGGWRTLLWLQYLGCVVPTFAAAWFGLALPHVSRKLGFLLGLVFLTLTLTPVLALQGVVYEPFTGVLGALVAGLVAIAFAGTLGAHRRYLLRRYFVGRVAVKTFDKVLAEGDGRQLSGRREVTALTCQLLNHAALARDLEPPDLEDFSSSFLKVVAEFLVAGGGYLDECDVHRVRVLYGFPVEDPNHAVSAAKAALELRQRIVNLSQEMDHRWHKKPVIGASLSSGEVVTGLFGFREFEFFSAVGGALDFGEKLCELNAEYGSHLLVSGATLAAAADGLEVRPLEMVEVPGFTPLTEVYELLALRHGLTEEQAVARDAFWQGVILLRKGDAKAALRQFERARQEGVEDAPLRYFQQLAMVGGDVPTGAQEPAGDGGGAIAEGKKAEKGAAAPVAGRAGSKKGKGQARVLGRRG
jgi:class 3 adenylate cyclase